jgi:acetyl-CoA synthetase
MSTRPTEASAAWWEEARGRLDGLPQGGLNIAHEAVDRHAHGELADDVAIRWLGARGGRREITYAELAASTSRFAGVLDALRVQRGERVFGLLPRIPELYEAVLGTLKAGAVFCPLFSAFGPEPVHQRLDLGDGRVLVTTPALYRRKVAPIRDRLPGLAHVLLVAGEDDELPGGTRALAPLMAAADPGRETTATGPEDMALLHFTSGTTGRPKGAVHVHEAVVAHEATARAALDLRPGDVFWCTADPGWVTGTSYGIVAPLVVGVTLVVDEAEFDPERWYGTLEREQVTVWYTAPTAIRMLMRAGDEVPGRFDRSSVRFMASVGEPLNPEAVLWSERVLGKPFHDTWWQTETGGIMVCNPPGEPVVPGAMGLPVPGVEIAVARRDALGELERAPDGELVLVDDPEEEGELVIRPGWPSMFRGYLGDEERYRAAFHGGWYCSGDLVRRDGDGRFWFVGRGDDVIKTAGHLIGPFEVESALLEHPGVAEAAAIGVPDELAGQVVKAFVVLKAGVEGNDALRRELLGLARKRLGPAVAPRQIAFADDLPHTRSGKIMRRVVRARELGLDEGDTSTLEGRS